MDPTTIANYAELLHKYLDAIPIESEEDFQVVQIALKSITDPTGHHEISPELKNKISDITFLIEQPELYATPEHQQEFKEIILSRVAGKIKELENKTSEDKIKYIQEQKDKRTQAAADQTLMSQRTPPTSGSEAHVDQPNVFVNPWMQVTPINQAISLLWAMFEARSAVINARIAELQPELTHIQNTVLSPSSKGVNHSIEDLWKTQVIINKWTALQNESADIIRNTHKLVQLIASRAIHAH